MKTTDKNRLDREVDELLQELRVVIPGVQVLFAFLLTVPFSSRFTEVTQLQRNGYFLALVCAAIAAGLLLAPSVYHRIQWRARDKEQMLRFSTALSVAGSVFLGASICVSLFVVTDFIFDLSAASVTAGGVALLLLVAWYAVPVYRRLQRGATADADSARRSRTG